MGDIEKGNTQKLTQVSSFVSINQCKYIVCLYDDLFIYNVIQIIMSNPALHRSWQPHLLG
jgi:hypothetical protein